jgi:hypothetical protein
MTLRLPRTLGTLRSVGVSGAGRSCKRYPEVSTGTTTAGNCRRLSYTSDERRFCVGATIRTRASCFVLRSETVQELKRPASPTFPLVGKRDEPLSLFLRCWWGAESAGLGSSGTRPLLARVAAYILLRSPMCHGYGAQTLNDHSAYLRVSGTRCRWRALPWLSCDRCRPLPQSVARSARMIHRPSGVRLPPEHGCEMASRVQWGWVLRCVVGNN